MPHSPGVDTGACSNLWRMPDVGRKPVRDAIRTGELVTWFSRDYPCPDQRGTPFSIINEAGPGPWNANTRLLYIGIQGVALPKHATGSRRRHLPAVAR